MLILLISSFFFPFFGGFFWVVPARLHFRREGRDLFLVSYRVPALLRMPNFLDLEGWVTDLLGNEGPVRFTVPLLVVEVLYFYSSVIDPGGHGDLDKASRGH